MKIAIKLCTHSNTYGKRSGGNTHDAAKMHGNMHTKTGINNVARALTMWLARYQNTITQTI